MIKSKGKLNTKTLQSWFNTITTEAFEQDVTLEVENSQHNYSQLVIDTQIIEELDKLFLKILDFTPSECKIRISIESIIDNEVYINTLIEGIDLFRISEILLVTQLTVNQQSIAGKNTLYQIFVPSSVSKQWSKPLNFSPYYIELNNSLRNHFIENHSGDKIIKTSEEQDNFLRRVNKLLELHIQDEDFGVIDLAEALHISRTHLYRRIKKITNESPLSYIILFKLELAKQLLLDSDKDLSITEVAYTSGFLDKSHFSRSFKKLFGVTPSNFKNKSM